MVQKVPMVTLNSGRHMPLIGIGSALLTGRASAEVTASALAEGYRLVDTAASYGNEQAVGLGIRESGLSRDDIFVTTKLRGKEQGNLEAVRAALEGSLDRLGQDYVDLYLIHWPLPGRGNFVESYVAMLELAQEGLIRSVGVSNFTMVHLEQLVAATGVWPSVNQVQVSPSAARTKLVDTLRQTPTTVQAWSPLENGSGVLRSRVISALAYELGVSPAQVVLRWHLERGLAVIPHSTVSRHRRNNLDIFGFSLTQDHHDAIASLDRGETMVLNSDVYEEL